MQNLNFKGWLIEEQAIFRDFLDKILNFTDKYVFGEYGGNIFGSITALLVAAGIGIGPGIILNKLKVDQVKKEVIKAIEKTDLDPITKEEKKKKFIKDFDHTINNISRK